MFELYLPGTDLVQGAPKLFVRKQIPGINPDHSLNTRGHVWMNTFLYPLTAIIIAATCRNYSTGLLLNMLSFVLTSFLAITKQSPAQDGK